MKTLRSIFIFYKKLILPAMVFSAITGLISLGITGEFSFKTAGISYILMALLFHYFIYEVRNHREYYFYYNLGLSKLTLWIITFVLSCVIGLSISLL